MDHNNQEFPILVAQAGPLNGQRWALKKSLTIGRDQACDIIIPDRQVSRFHAEITPTRQGFLLKDLGSKNGTHRNGEMITQPVLLQDGDLIQVAIAQKFIYLGTDATLPLERIPQGDKEASVTTRLRLDLRSHQVWAGKKEILPPLSVAQFRLLQTLYQSQGRLVSRAELIRAVWGEEDAVEVSEQALDALIRRLRDRLADADPAHTYLITVRGHGIRLDNPPLD